MITEIVKDSAEATTPTPRQTTEDSAPVVREIAPVVPDQQDNDQVYSVADWEDKKGRWHKLMVLNPTSRYPVRLGAGKLRLVLQKDAADRDFLSKYGEEK